MAFLGFIHGSRWMRVGYAIWRNIIGIDYVVSVGIVHRPRWMWIDVTTWRNVIGIDDVAKWIWLVDGPRRVGMRKNNRWAVF